MMWVVMEKKARRRTCQANQSERSKVILNKNIGLKTLTATEQHFLQRAIVMGEKNKKQRTDTRAGISDVLVCVWTGVIRRYTRWDEDPVPPSYAPSLFCTDWLTGNIWHIRPLLRAKGFKMKRIWNQTSRGFKSDPETKEHYIMSLLNLTLGSGSK